MPSVISDFKTKRLVEYLEPGDEVLIKFDNHGIGDMIMFQPLYQKMKRLYPDVHFHLLGNRDQQYFYETPEAPVTKSFYIKFPETVTMFGSRPYSMSKPEACAVLELGIPYDAKELEFTWKPSSWVNADIPDNCIGVVFQVCCNASRSLEYGTAAAIWKRIKDNGFTPIEVVFKNLNLAARNGRFGFIDRSCRDLPANPETMIGVIKKCKGFLGVNTGTFCAATALMHGDVIHLRKNEGFAPCYKRYEPVKEVLCNNGVGGMDWSVIDQYLAKRRS